MFEKISTSLINLLKANTLIQSVYNFEASKLDGFPALTITPSANESDYTSTTENRRVYSFVIRLYVERLSGNTAESVCESTMRQLVDTVLNTLDHAYGMSTLDPQTGYLFLKMSAAPSQWGYAGVSSQLRVAEIKVTLHFDVDTTLIS